MSRKKAHIGSLFILILLPAFFCSDSPEPVPGMKPDDPAADRGIMAPYPDTVTVTVIKAPTVGSGEEGENEGEESESEIETESESGSAHKTVVRTITPPATVDIVVSAEAKGVLPPPDPDPLHAAGLAPLVIVGEQLQTYPGQLQIQHAPMAGPRIFPYHQKPSNNRKAGKLAASYEEIPLEQPAPKPDIRITVEERPQEKPQPAKKPIYEKPLYDHPAPLHDHPAPLYDRPAPLHDRPAPLYDHPAPPAHQKVIHTAHIVQGSAPVPAILPAPNYSNTIYNTVNRHTNLIHQVHSSTIYNAPNSYPQSPSQITVVAKTNIRPQASKLTATFPVYPKKYYQNPKYRIANAQSPYDLGSLVPSPPGHIDQPVAKLPPRYPPVPVENQPPRYPPVENPPPRYPPVPVENQPPRYPPVPVEKPIPTEIPPSSEAPRYYPQPSYALRENPGSSPMPTNYPNYPPPTPSNPPPTYQRNHNHHHNHPPPYEPSARPPTHFHVGTDLPLCSRESGLGYCLTDTEYPSAEINAYIAMYPEKYQLLRPMVPWKIIAGQPTPGQNPPDHPITPDPQPVNLDQNPATQRNPDACRSHSLASAKVLRATNAQDKWKVIVHLPDAIQTCNLDTCDTNRACRLLDPFVDTSCVQEYALQQLMVYSPEFGVHVDDVKIPRGCRCRVVGHHQSAPRRHPLPNHISPSPPPPY